MISPGPLPAAASQAAHRSGIQVASDRTRRPGRWRSPGRRFAPPPWGPATALLAFLAQNVILFAIEWPLYLLGVRQGLVAGATIVDIVLIASALVVAERTTGRP